MGDMPQPLKQDAGGTKFPCFWDPDTGYAAIPRAPQLILINGQYYSWSGVTGGYERIILLIDEAVINLWTGSGADIFSAKGYNRISAYVTHDSLVKNVTLRFYRRLAQTGADDYLPALEMGGIPGADVPQVRDIELPPTPFLKPEVVVEGGGSTNITLTILLSYG